MSAGLVDKIKGVKERLFSMLESMQENLKEIRTDIKETRIDAGYQFKETQAKVDVLNAQVHNLAAEAKWIEQAHYEQLVEYITPSSDDFSYPDDLEQYLRANPEIALLQYLRSFVPSSNVIDIGANVGDVSALLLSAGYRIYAFEPMPETYERLSERFVGVTSGFKSYPYAVGSADGLTEFYAIEVTDEARAQSMDADLSVYATTVKHAVPEGVQYASPIEVKVRSLKSLHAAGEVPSDIGVLKIDTEGGDLEVIRGMGTVKYSVIVSEFWDSAHYFSAGQFGLISDTVGHLRARGYNWHIVIYRAENSNEARFYCNLDMSVKNSWGNVIFFRDYEVFREALKWCSSMLRANHSFRI